ncbi:MAG: MMPL family transporter [Candidatus Saccharimonadales bacterium]
MGPFLKRLGEHGYTHKWRYILCWVVAIIILGIGALAFIKPTSSAISIPGTQAQQALDRANELFPELGSGSGRVVIAAPSSKKLTDFAKSVDSLVNELSTVDGVGRVISPSENPMATSKDGTVAYIQLQLTEGQGSVEPKTIDAVASAVSTARTSGMTVEMGGDVINKTPNEILGVGEVAGVVIALLVLALTLGSLVAAGMPIIIALVTIVVSMAGLFSLSEVFEINATTPVLAVMLGLAVGIDYSLFIINKYRVLIKAGMDNKAAVGNALATAGNAVVFAAATVVIALAALTVVQIPFMSIMGLTGAATIALAALVAITLVPALLGVAGNKVFRAKHRSDIIKNQQTTVGHDQRAPQNFWYRWGASIVKRPIVALLGALIVIGALAWPVQHLQLGLPTDQYAAAESTERKAYDLLTAGFGEGFNGPLLVVAEGLPAVTDADMQAVRKQVTTQYEARVRQETAKQQLAFEKQAAQATTVEDQLALQQAIADAQAKGATQQEAAPKVIEAQVAQYAPLVHLQSVAQKLAHRTGIAQVLPLMTTYSGTKGLLQITPTKSPSDKMTIDVIHNLRDPATQRALSADGHMTLAVTGSTALQTDINTKLSSAIPVYLSVVVGLSLLLLVIAFRSILVPLKATLGFLLSVLAMFGCLVAVFQWGWFGIADAPGPIVSFIPIIAVGILFGLAMDYEFFLVSGMHEVFQRTHDAKRAVVEGFGQGAKVVTAAFVIMVSVFGGFITNHDVTIQAIGFGLAIGILVDALLVRMTIVPAIMTLMGRHAWWLPKWLDKILPHVSIEGEVTAQKVPGVKQPRT